MNSRTVSWEGRGLAQPSHVDIRSCLYREPVLDQAEKDQYPILLDELCTHLLHVERFGEAREPRARALDADSLSSNLAGDRSNLDEFVIVKY